MTTWTVSSAAELASALKGASGGDTILLQNGNYGDLNITQDFSSIVTIKATNPLGAKFSGIDISGATNIKIDGVTASDGVFIGGGSSKIVISNSNLSGMFFSEGANNITVTGNDIHTGSVGFLNVNNIDFVSNTVHDVVGNDAMQIMGNTYNLLVENNSILDVIATRYIGAPRSHTVHARLRSAGIALRTTSQYAAISSTTIRRPG